MYYAYNVFPFVLMSTLVVLHLELNEFTLTLMSEDHEAVLVPPLTLSESLC